METNNLKQQAIEAAYGEFWEQVKDLIDEKGWCDYDYWFKFISLKIDHEYKEPNSLKLRPKSLAGIETNNGWIRIESKDDLPKEDGLYFVYREKLDETESFDVFKNKGWSELNSNLVTHYQPITIPKPPIF